MHLARRPSDSEDSHSVCWVWLSNSRIQLRPVWRFPQKAWFGPGLTFHGASCCFSNLLQNLTHSDFLRPVRVFSPCYCFAENHICVLPDILCITFYSGKSSHHNTLTPSPILSPPSQCWPKELFVYIYTRLIVVCVCVSVYNIDEWAPKWACLLFSSAVRGWLAKHS